MLEYPHYTRPPEFRNWRVPDVLLSGHHEQIARWRRKEALRRTRQRRPDLYAQLDLSSKQDKKIVKELDAEEQEQHDQDAFSDHDSAQ
jgi:tRNA (guanine37-N1)-methyltransferase